MDDFAELKRVAEALLSENEELRQQNAGLIEDRARFPDRPDFVGNMIGAHIGNLKHAAEQANKFSAQHRLRAEVLERDAERYRWMRSSFVRNHKHSLVWYLPMLSPLTADGLDANIDAAIAALREVAHG